MTFICGATTVTPPRCCSCPSTARCMDVDDLEVDDIVDCPATCEFCTAGCKYPPDLVDEYDDKVLIPHDDGECCMYAEPPPEEHPLHPSQMPMGWPRPMFEGLPHPYIAEKDNLGKVEKHRRQLCVSDRRCQVCGEKLGDWSIGCWRWDAHGRRERVEDVIITDGAAVCLRCWPVALRKCPELHRQWEMGNLVVACVRTESWEEMSASLVQNIMGMATGYKVPTT